MTFHVRRKGPAALLAALLVALSLVAAPAFVSAADEKETELQKKMEEIETGLKKLRRTLRKTEENAESLKTIGQVKGLMEECKKLAPAMASSVPEAERAKFIESYKKDMDAVIAEMGKMEKAVKGGKNDEAQAILKKLSEMEEAGHEKYIKDETKKTEKKDAEKKG
jgi:soluble cytochrome b562